MGSRKGRQEDAEHPKGTILMSAALASPLRIPRELRIRTERAFISFKADEKTSRRFTEIQSPQILVVLVKK
jgi:hypothetical protein